MPCLFPLIQPDNANTPFEACIEIGGHKYGKGQAKSKRLAKMEAGEYQCQS